MRLRPVLVTVACLLVAPSAASAADELLGTCGSDLCVAAPGAAPVALTSDGAQGSYGSVSASGDGQRIVYVRGSTLFRAGARNAAPETLFEAAPGSGREAVISADGGSFAFRTFQGGFSGGTYQVESTVRIGGAQGSFLWSSASQVSVPGYVGNTLVLAQTAEGQPKEVVCRAALIPDGPPPCGQAYAADPARDVGSPDASPDGRLVAATATDTTTDPSTTLIALFDATTGAKVRDLTTGPSDFAPSVSPDGTQVAFTRGGDTLVVPVGGGEARPLVTGMSGASWYRAPDAPTTPGGPVTPGGPTTPAVTGRPSRPASKLRVDRKRRLILKVRCTARTGCLKTRWTFKQGKTTRLTVNVPALKSGADRTLKVKLSRRLVKRIKRKTGLKLRLTGKGLKPKTIRFVR